MNFKELDYLKSDGFVGYKSVGELMTDHSRIPSVGGVYVFLRPSDDAPEFLEEGTGGFFKRSAPKDPKVTGENPRDVEERIIADFKARHNGQRPFANLQD